MRSVPVRDIFIRDNVCMASGRHRKRNDFLSAHEACATAPRLAQAHRTWHGHAPWQYRFTAPFPSSRTLDLDMYYVQLQEEREGRVILNSEHVHTHDCIIVINLPTACPRL